MAYLNKTNYYFVLGQEPEIGSRIVFFFSNRTSPVNTGRVSFHTLKLHVMIRALVILLYIITTPICLTVNVNFFISTQSVIHYRAPCNCQFVRNCSGKFAKLNGHKQDCWIMKLPGIVIF